MKFIDLTGQRFERLVVVERAPNRGKKTYWRCVCDCGTVCEISSTHLRDSHTRSCGCLFRERVDATAAVQACEGKTRNYPHGRTGTTAGYDAHQYAKEPACDPCRAARLQLTRRRLANLTPEQRQRRLITGRAATRRYMDNNPDAYREKRERLRQRGRAIIHEAKSAPCTDCGRRYPYYVMQFDHLRDKSFNIAASGTHASAERLRAEIAKCQVVCANCHAERTHQRARAKQSRGQAA